MSNDTGTEPRLELVVRFGSTVQGRARPDSDLDVAVLADRELSLAERQLVVLGLARRHGFPEDRIDLVDLRAASPLLQHEVAEHGQLLEGDPDDFLRFRVSAWKVYQDTARLRRARQQRLRDALDVP
jgi:predicted nucleotidyltransferase